MRGLRDPGGDPGQDLKPLYDFALDCQECRAKLQAAQGDLLDERAKTKTLTKERDDALHAANGGSVLARIARAVEVAAHRSGGAGLRRGRWRRGRGSLF